MKDILALLKQTNSIITDTHVVLTSGKHSSVYINKDALYPHTEVTSQVGELFATTFATFSIDVVAAPALGGIILSQWTAYHLSKKKHHEVLGVYTEKTPEKNQVFTRGYDKLVSGKNVLVIEDLTTTGESVKKVITSVKAAGGIVVAVGVMVNRNPTEVNEALMGVPFTALGVLPVESYEEGSCILCEKNIPINTDVGHGKKYLDTKTSKK